MKVTQLAVPSLAAPLFAGWEETFIWSALQGEMGCVWSAGDSLSAAAVVSGDLAFLGGDGRSKEAQALLGALSGAYQDRYLILAHRDSRWEDGIKAAFPDARPMHRYAMKKEPDCFDVGHLKALADSLPAEFTLAPIDEPLYHRMLCEKWSRDFCSRFESAEDFARRGLGFVALFGGEPVGGASSYIRYREGIEIQVDTRLQYRRRGIAAACCARLILECLSRGLYPSWDAANRESAALARKLGYHEKGEYSVWESGEE